MVALANAQSGDPAVAIEWPSIDQLTPSVDRRNSTVVVLLVQPVVPLFTDHINQSPAPRLTTVGETMV